MELDGSRVKPDRKKPLNRRSVSDDRQEEVKNLKLDLRKQMLPSEFNCISHLLVSMYPSHGLPSVSSGSQNTWLYLDVFQKYSQVCGRSSRREYNTPFEETMPAGQMIREISLKRKATKNDADDVFEAYYALCARNVRQRRPVDLPRTTMSADFRSEETINCEVFRKHTDLCTYSISPPVSIHRVKPCVNPAARIPGDATTNFSAAAATTSGGNPQVVYNQVINSPCTENEDPNHTSSSDSNSLHSYRFLIRLVKHAVFYHWRSWERFKNMRLGFHSEPQLRRHVCNLLYEACNSNLLHWRSGMHSEPQLRRRVCNLWYAASNSNLIS
ncbi:hypothetical protein Tco_1011870 [Tanacetum coccineum]